MPLNKCPRPEALLELITIAGELSLRETTSLRLHTLFCPSCQVKLKTLRKAWDSCGMPEPDITSSLLKVYSNLQNDETLILSGWKLGGSHRRETGWSHWLFKEGWLFRGGVAVGITSILAFLIVTSIRNETPQLDSHVEARQTSEIPYVQFRMQDKNTVKVRYVQPELLQTLEFETASAE